jgi:DNA replication protein DnaC
MLTKINDVNYDPQLFESYLTHTAIDGMFSIGEGIPRATNWMIVGDPGVGKTAIAEGLAFKIINDDQTFSIVVQVFNTFSTVANVFLCENVIHFLLFFYYERPNYKSI